MYAHGVVVRFIAAFFMATVPANAPASALSSSAARQEPSQQTPAPAGHQHPAPAAEPQHVHPQPDADAMTMFPSREASGTAWLPDLMPMYGIHRQARGWELMAHGNAFAQFLYESGDRGSDQVGSIHWAMGMARRQVGAGRLGLRGMFSLEPWTIRGCGLPGLAGER